MNALTEELRQLIVDALDLEDVRPGDIDPEAPLFGDGLGLDSIDALELGVAIQKKYDVKLNANASETRTYFFSVANLTRFIESQQKN